MINEPNQQPIISNNERNWAMLCHLAALSTVIGIVFGWILGPLIVWLAKKNEFSFVDDQGKESLNFQLSMTIYTVILALLVVATLIIAGILASYVMIVIAYAAAFVVGGAMILLWFIAVISAAIAASGGKRFRYRFTIRFIK